MTPNGNGNGNGRAQDGRPAHPPCVPCAAELIPSVRRKRPGV